jgi:Ribosomal protein L7/L12 C-terminal domain
MAEKIPDLLLAQLTEAILAGRKIEAIKLHREMTGLGLKESKDQIEELEQELRVSHPEKFTKAPGGSGCAMTAAKLLCLAATLSALATWWTSHT